MEVVYNDNKGEKEDGDWFCYVRLSRMSGWNSSELFLVDYCGTFSFIIILTQIAAVASLRSYSFRVAL